MSRKRQDAIPRNKRQYESLLDSLAVLNAARRFHLPLSAAARTEHVKPSTVLRFTGRAWRKRGSDFVPKPTDRILRTVQIVGSKGLETHAPRNPRDASLFGKYSSARSKYLRTGDYSDLRKFKNRRMPGTKRLFPTNPAKIRAQAKAGLEPQEFYAPWRIAHR
jgi:hypothetical protein